ncbi:ATP-binding protein [Gillisia limnaea]|uniref:histidine kinase n=1 Tax=Gillisia limnaea (strain DSM 15749 / LMG 21470 / R-8282) TaxID=865937 RepID=H2BW43_GILLR|nr:ATP-binding protein [Gillisia limnaea]EHQ02960.1 histidine kinase [Gillisia limnaea DSM 15749]
MNTAKINELESVHLEAVKLITDLSSLSSEHLNEHLFNKIFAPSFHIYGATREEITCFEQYEDLVKRQNKLTKDSNDKKLVDSNPVLRSYSPNGEVAVYVDNLKFRINDSKAPKEVEKRVSLVLFKLSEGWRVSHLHLSSIAANFYERENLPKGEWEMKNMALEKMVEAQNIDLINSLEQLNDVKAQLIRQEKLASLGQLTAGIAHEIKNPLNFINNFSELSVEFLLEIEENLNKIETNEVTDEIKSLLEDVKGNLEKIHQHGTRADGIVKSMLLHSRGGNGKMEDTDLNALIREYVNLSFHGMRANKNPINVDIQIETDDNLQPVKINAENFSRVILNLCKNAFDAMREKVQKANAQNYLPQLKVKTRADDKKIILEIEDNGPGVSEEIKEKMMLPFFTTKKGSEGTGLGLSISQDIIKSHGGILELESKEGEFTRFIITLDRTDQKL